MVFASVGDRFLGWLRGEEAARGSRRVTGGVGSNEAPANDSAPNASATPAAPQATPSPGLDPWGDPSGIPEFGTPSRFTKRPARPKRYILIEGPTSLQVRRTYRRWLAGWAIVTVVASVTTPFVIAIVRPDLLSNGVSWLGVPGIAIFAAQFFRAEKYSERVRKEHAAGYTFRRVDSLEVDQIDAVSRYVIRARHQRQLTVSEELAALERVRAIRIDGRH